MWETTSPGTVSTKYVWRLPAIAGLLTRKNKCSSAAFSALREDSTTKRHTFRLTLYKGIQPAATEAEDSVGLVLELLADGKGTLALESLPGMTQLTAALYEVTPTAATSAAPPSSDARETPDRSASQPRPAGEAALTHRLLVEETTSALMAAEGACLMLPTFISATLLSSSPSTSTTVRSYWELTVRLQFGAVALFNPVVSQLRSFWSSLSSSVSEAMPSVLSRLETVREDLVEGVTAAYAAGEQAVATATTSAASASTPPPPPPAPWEVTPPSWVDCEDEWQQLVRQRLPQDDRTFTCGPKLESEYTVSGVERLEQHGYSIRALLALYQNEESTSQQLHDGLLIEELKAVRYRLVPRVVSDEAFWAAYLWKVACCAQCLMPQEVEVVLRVISGDSEEENPVEPAPSPSHHQQAESKDSSSPSSPRLETTVTGQGSTENRRSEASVESPLGAASAAPSSVEGDAKDDDIDFPRMPWEEEE